MYLSERQTRPLLGVSGSSRPRTHRINKAEGYRLNRALYLYKAPPSTWLYNLFSAPRQGRQARMGDTPPPARGVACRVAVTRNGGREKEVSND